MFDLNSPDFYYNELTKLIGNEICNSLSRGEKNCDGYVKWDYPFEIYDDAPFVYWSSNVQRIKGDIKDRWDIHAWSGSNELDEPGIELLFYLKKGLWTKNHGIDLPELYNVVAHELHHLTQEEDQCERKMERLASYDYFMLPYEREAFHIGFRAQSAMSNVDIEECMLNYLTPRINMGLLTLDQVSTIIKAWTDVTWDCSRKQ